MLGPVLGSVVFAAHRTALLALLATWRLIERDGHDIETPSHLGGLIAPQVRVWPGFGHCLAGLGGRSLAASQAWLLCLAAPLVLNIIISAGHGEAGAGTGAIAGRIVLPAAFGEGLRRSCRIHR